MGVDVMKKFIVIFITSTIIALLLILLSGCGYELEPSNKNEYSSIVQTSAEATTETEAKAVPPKTEEEAIQFIIDNIKAGNYKDAWYYTYDFKSSECKTLNVYAYALLLNKEKDYWSRNANIEMDIDPNYKGSLADEIKNFCLKYADAIYDEHADIVNGKFVGKMVYQISEIKTKAELDARVPPKIGMTDVEAYNSTWGYPDDINKTTTKNNVSEQWVYEKSNFDFKYIYLENDIVTAIQE
jgi:hypothetical protein